MSWEDFAILFVFGVFIGFIIGYPIGVHRTQYGLANRHCEAISDRHEFEACKEEFLK
jgi:nitrate/nitrite transporter NarK